MHIFTTSSKISIHAPAKGATASGFSKPVPCRDFNPRSREGSDKIQVQNNAEDEISIHAPAKGATALIAVIIAAILFQSTLPRRERLQICNI